MILKQIANISMVKLKSFHTVDKSVVKTKAKVIHCANDPILMNLIVSSNNYDSVVNITNDSE